MAYNSVAITPGVGAAISVDVIGGVDLQRVKLAIGAEGVGVDVSTAAPMPITAPSPISVTVGTPSLNVSGLTTRAAIALTTSGDNTIVAGSGALLVRVWRMYFSVSAPVNIKFGDTTVTYFSGTSPFGVNGGMVLDFNKDEPWFTTAAGKGFVINLSANVTCAGMLWYTQV